MTFETLCNDVNIRPLMPFGCSNADRRPLRPSMRIKDLSMRGPLRPFMRMEDPWGLQCELKTF